MYQAKVLVSVLAILMPTALALPAGREVHACEAAKQYFYSHIVRVS